MLRSMTGFGAGRAEAAEAGGTVAAEVELRAVNHRYLQVKVRVPGEWSELEGQIEALVKKRLARGAVTAGVRVETPGGARAAEVDLDVVARYRKAIDALAGAVGDVEGLSLSGWLRLPGVLRDAEPAASNTVPKLVLQAARTALDELLVMREREGEAMRRDLEKHAKQLGVLRGKLERRVPKLVREHLAKLTERIEALLGSERPVDETELARELALIADRGDVSEELARLDSHLDQLAELCGSAKPVGRQLDFLVQELLREVNTIGSKVSDAQAALWVVEAKTCVERLREQVQNVE